MNFTQEQIEKELSDAIPHGMREEIAKGTGIYPKIVDAYFNPNDERKSPHFTVLHIQDTLDNKNLVVGEAVWRKMNSLRESSKPHQFTTPELCVDHELGNLSKEITDVIVARCEDKPLTEQLQEIAEARHQLAKYEKAVLAGGSTVRAFAREAVQRRRAR